MFPRVIMRLCGWCGTSALLAACALTPEQQAARAARIEAAQEAQHIALAQQCDPAVAELLRQRRPVAQFGTEAEQLAWQQTLTEQTERPVFRACYRLAVQNLAYQQRLQQLQWQRDWDDWMWRPRRCLAGPYRPCF